MNVDQLKEKLLMLEPNAGDFLLVFSGKTSKKVHGLYKPETKEIIIHNKNFNEDHRQVLPVYGSTLRHR